MILSLFCQENVKQSIEYRVIIISEVNQSQNERGNMDWGNWVIVMTTEWAVKMAHYVTLDDGYMASYYYGLICRELAAFNDLRAVAQ
jgi:hypothetical protein